jgi:hypothetical protein
MEYNKVALNLAYRMSGLEFHCKKYGLIATMFYIGQSPENDDNSLYTTEECMDVSDSLEVSKTTPKAC